MKTLRWILFVWFLFATGCAAQGPFYVDYHFSPAEKAEIQSAADAWAVATGGLATVDFVWDARIGDQSRTIVRVEGVDPEKAGREEHIPYVVGTGRSTIQLLPDQCDKDHVELRRVILHEFGHAFGLHHDTTPGAVMYPDDDKAGDCVTAGDLMAYCAANSCPDGMPRPAACAPPAGATLKE
jgi:hypothetical protein